MVIIAHINKWDLTRVLVDNGSQAKILFLSAFDQMDYNRRQLLHHVVHGRCLLLLQSLQACGSRRPWPRPSSGVPACVLFCSNVWMTPYAFLNTEVWIRFVSHLHFLPWAGNNVLNTSFCLNNVAELLD
jgi:hypothetical protein